MVVLHLGSEIVDVEGCHDLTPLSALEENTDLSSCYFQFHCCVQGLQIIRGRTVTVTHWTEGTSGRIRAVAASRGELP